MPALNIPIKASKKQAKAMIAQKLADKTLSLAEERKLKDQYQEYNKGGVAMKQTPKQTKKGK